MLAIPPFDFCRPFAAEPAKLPEGGLAPASRNLILDQARGVSDMTHQRVRPIIITDAPIEDLVLDPDGHQLVDIKIAVNLSVVRLVSGVFGEALNRSAASGMLLQIFERRLKSRVSFEHIVIQIGLEKEVNRGAFPRDALLRADCRDCNQGSARADHRGK
jgi:hypothetical protein